MVTPEMVTPTTAEMEQVTRAKLMEDLRTVFVDVEELLKATASQTGERITAARAKAEESLEVAKARSPGPGARRADQGGRQAATTMASNPVKPWVSPRGWSFRRPADHAR